MVIWMREGGIGAQRVKRMNRPHVIEEGRAEHDSDTTQIAGISAVRNSGDHPFAGCYNHLISLI